MGPTHGFRGKLQFIRVIHRLARVKSCPSPLHVFFKKNIYFCAIAKVGRSQKIDPTGMELGETPEPTGGEKPSHI